MTTEIEAGSLTSDHVGSVLSVTWKTGKITSTVTDRLKSFVNEGSFVTLRFKDTQWRPFSLVGTAQDEGLRVGFRAIVQIEEVSA